MLINIKQENNKRVILKFEVPKEEVEKIMNEIYLKTKNNYPVIGIETGKAPMCIIEEQYGEAVFYNDTVNTCIDNEFKQMNERYNSHKLKRENVEEINLIQIGKDKDLIFELLVN